MTFRKYPNHHSAPICMCPHCHCIRRGKVSDGYERECKKLCACHMDYVEELTAWRVKVTFIPCEKFEDERYYCIDR